MEVSVPYRDQVCITRTNFQNSKLKAEKLEDFNRNDSMKPNNCLFDTLITNALVLKYD